MTINVVHGGLIRMSFPLDSDSGAFSAGGCVELTAAGEVRAFTGSSTTSVKGIALANKVDLTSTSADSKLGVPSGDQVEVLLDEAVIETDQTDSGVTWSPNDTVYPCATGELTDSNGVDHVLGKALAQKTWSETALLFFSAQY